MGHTALLDRKVALITGAGSGIGAAVATLFAHEGAHVVLADQDREHAERVLARITDEGGKGMAVRTDVSDADACAHMVAQTVRHFGRLDIAVNNAGIGGPSATVGDYPIEGWNKVIAVNLTGVFHCMRFQLPELQRNPGGAIINISSILGQVALPGAGAYTAAKHGVIGLTRSAAVEYAAQGIRVNAVGPGFIRTPMLDQIPPDQLDAFAAMHPAKRLGRPEEVAELVLWLASDKASFVTGAYYSVDGGYLAQ